jgi:16S rRNA pseudouridine516 synthase
VRLDKFLSVTGTATRSEASRAVRSGRVTVNGLGVKSADHKIDPEKDTVCFDGVRIVYREFTYIMLNKPTGYVSATDDKNLPTVLELLPDELRRLDLFPAGRLDRDTVGLMLLTDDGVLAHFLLSPVSHVPKSYRFTCQSPLSDNDVSALESGVDIGEDHITKPSSLTVENDRISGTITISEGRYHQIKRMFEAVGNKITSLERITFGPLSLDPSLSRGEWRFLTSDEIKELQKHNRNTNGETK